MVLTFLYFLPVDFVQIYAVFFIDFEENGPSFLFLPFVIPIHLESGGWVH